MEENATVADSPMLHQQRQDRPEQEIEPLLRRLTEPGMVIVTGPEGSGRNTLAPMLAGRLPEAGRVDLPALSEPDAASAMILAAGSLLNDAVDRLLDKAGRPEPWLADRLRELSTIVILRTHGRRLAVGAAKDIGSDVLAERRRSALLALRALPRAIWILDEREAGDLRDGSSACLSLPDFQVQLDPAHWGDLNDAAERLAPGVADLVASPVVWRLAVGTTHLGTSTEEVAAWARRPAAEAIPGLVRILVRHLRTHDELCARVRSLILPRRAFLLPSWGERLGGPGAERDLLTRVIGYGDPLRVNPLVRQHLAEALGPDRASVREETHAQVARVAEVEDGAESPRGLYGPALAAWVEKVHHLGLGGRHTEAEWARQEKLTPESWWERARFLSVVKRDDKAAATLYQACLQRFPGDSYAHHYLAWNLQKANREPALQREHYARAVELDPRNPWWNARRISQLIEAGLSVDALRAWREALTRLCPDGQVRPGLAERLHWWVAEAWCRSGAWYEARAVLRGLPQSAQQGSARSWRRIERDIEQLKRQERDAFRRWLDQDPRARSWASRAWEILLARLPDLPVPAGTDGEDGLKLVWSHAAVYLEIEERPDGRIAWYARDRLTDRLDGAEDASLDDQPLQPWLGRAQDG